MVDEDTPAKQEPAKSVRRAPSRWTTLLGAIFILAVVVLVCLLPEENRDFFWQLRTGDDILRTGRLPHVDSYSWERAGTPWYVPEWLSFVLQSLAFRAGAYFATWLAMVLLTLAASMLVWTWLLRRVHAVTALTMTTLMLMSMALAVQERPYLFTYILLALSLRIIVTARKASIPRSLLWLLPIAALWANLHQGATVLPVLLIAFAIGDILTALNKHRSAASAKWMLSTAAGCALAEMVSPYGWGIYKNVAVTVGEPTAMRTVIEWSPVTRFPAEAFAGFYILAAVVVLGYLASRRPRDLGELIAVGGLLIASILHVRDIPLFAIVAAMTSTVHVESAAARLLTPIARRLSEQRTSGFALASPLALVFLVLLARASIGELRSVLTPGAPVTPETVGEAVMEVNWYPARPCLYMKQEGFPDGLRLYNDYGMGGYLIYALPTDRVFMDGRNDIYTGDALRDFVDMNDFAHLDIRKKAVDKYDFDCVITGDERQAVAFAASGGWAEVYVDDDGRYILLRNRPQWQTLIAQCQRDMLAAKSAQ